MALARQATRKLLAIDLVEAVLQSERAECGLACLSMLTRLHGHPFSLSEMRARFRIGANGMNLAEVARCAQELGYTCRGLRLEPEHLGSLRLPAILHWNLDHFVVVSRVRKKQLELYDPAIGRHWLSYDEVGEKFTGVALEVWPKTPSDLQTGQTNQLSLSDVWRNAPERAKNFSWVIFLTIALQVLVLVGPWHVQWLVDEALPTANHSLLTVLAVGFGGLMLLRIFLQWLRGVVVAELGHSLAYVFASQLLSKLVFLPLAWYQRRGIGEIVSRFESLNPIRDFITQGAAAWLVDLVLIALSLVLMLIYEPMLALIVVGLQAIAVTVSMLFSNKLREQNMRAVVLKAREHSHLLESVRAVHSVKVYGQEDARLSAWQRLHGETLGASLALQRTHLGLEAWMGLMTGVELIAVLSLGGWGVLTGNGFTIGMLMAFLSYRGHFSERLVMVVEQWLNLRILKIHLQRLEDVWLQEPEPRPSLAPSESGHPADLRLSQLCFSYDGHQNVLDNAELKISRGSWVAIVGDSGVGKSTVMRLMMGLVKPDAGSVYEGAIPLSGVSAVEFRRRCGCVLQEDGFFAGSIADNIALFAPPDMARVDQVLELVGLRGCIEALPMQALSQIGEIDMSLSSGEMQRLYLARALYRNPDYLFLDEGTANLDLQSALVIQHLLSKLDCTRITITHDLEFARAADEVWRLADGRFDRVSKFE